jgi:hypothetical protein
MLRLSWKCRCHDQMISDSSGSKERFNLISYPRRRTSESPNQYKPNEFRSIYAANRSTLLLNFCHARRRS